MRRRRTKDDKRAQPGSPMTAVLTPKDVAQALKLSISTVYLHAATGVLPAYRVGKHWRFDEAELEKALAKMSNQRGKRSS